MGSIVSFLRSTTNNGTNKRPQQEDEFHYRGRPGKRTRMEGTNSNESSTIGESKRRPSRDDMQHIQQHEYVHEGNRMKCVNWLIAVADFFCFCEETIHGAVVSLDLMLSLRELRLEDLTTLGLSCLLLSAEVYETHRDIPTLECSVLVSMGIDPNTTVCEQVAKVRKMESDVTSALKSIVGIPKTITFIGYIISAVVEEYSLKADPNLEFLAKYLGELTLLDYKLRGYSPSLAASSIVYLAMLTLHPSLENPWNQTLQNFTGYKLLEMEECVRDIFNLHSNTDKILLEYDGPFRRYCKAKVRPFLIQNFWIVLSDKTLTKVTLECGSSMGSRCWHPFLFFLHPFLVAEVRSFIECMSGFYGHHLQHLRCKNFLLRSHEKDNPARSLLLVVLFDIKVRSFKSRSKNYRSMLFDNDSDCCLNYGYYIEYDDLASYMVGHKLFIIDHS